jgi:hypothetical protein
MMTLSSMQPAHSLQDKEYATMAQLAQSVTTDTADPRHFSFAGTPHALEAQL